MATLGTEVRVEWHGRTVTAWRPSPLADRDDLIPTVPGTVRATERARQVIIAADQHTPAHWEPLARLLLRSEGVASSYVEGVAAPIADVVAAQEDPDAASAAAAWVAANLSALDHALAHAASAAALKVTDLHAWHRTLMHGHTLLPDRLVGALRDEQGWIGGATPLDAALVTAPTADVPALMDDLLGYLNTTVDDPVAQAAVGHAQFEVIHPYGDGNGRLGRLLILWTLTRRLGVRVLPPLSVRIAADPGGYLSGLTAYRLTDAGTWIRWFADTLTDAAAHAADVMARLSQLPAAWAGRLDARTVRADASARRLLDHLIAHPVLTASMAASYVETTDRAARGALRTLAEAGVVVPFDPGVEATRPASSRGRPHQWWNVTDVTGLITAR